MRWYQREEIQSRFLSEDKTVVVGNKNQVKPCQSHAKMSQSKIGSPSQTKWNRGPKVNSQGESKLEPRQPHQAEPGINRCQGEPRGAKTRQGPIGATTQVKSRVVGSQEAPIILELCICSSNNWTGADPCCQQMEAKRKWELIPKLIGAKFQGK